MSGAARSRRPAPSPEKRGGRPLYARVLRLRRLDPGGLVCFLYFEGAVALGILTALAELVPWWGVPILPLTVAIMVKVNDMIADGAATAGTRRALPAGAHERRRGRAPQRRIGASTVARRTPARSVREEATASPPAAPAVAARPAETRIREPEDFTYTDDQSVSAEHRVSRQRLEHESVDSPRQRSRQSASRRYG
jgi:hypothetical protein